LISPPLLTTKSISTFVTQTPVLQVSNPGPLRPSCVLLLFFFLHDILVGMIKAITKWLTQVELSHEMHETLTVPWRVYE